MACRLIEKSKGEMDIVVDFWNGHTIAFLAILTSWTPEPVMITYELASATLYLLLEGQLCMDVESWNDFIQHHAGKGSSLKTRFGW